jgi:hypothetical protein
MPTDQRETEQLVMWLMSTAKSVLFIVAVADMVALALAI